MVRMTLEPVSYCLYILLLLSEFVLTTGNNRSRYYRDNYALSFRHVLKSTIIIDIINS